MRKGFAIIGCVLLLISCRNYTSAQTAAPGISPLMEYIINSETQIAVDADGVATICCQAYGYMGTTTHIKIDAMLQRYVNGSWRAVRAFVKESDSHRVSLSETHTLVKGYSYRVKATVTAFCGSVTETDVLTSNAVTY